MGVDTQPGGKSSLRIKIHHQHTAAILREGPTQTNGGGRLPDATFLVTQRDNACWTVGFEDWGLGKIADRAPCGARLYRCFCHLPSLQRSAIGRVDGHSDRPRARYQSSLWYKSASSTLTNVPKAPAQPEYLLPPQEYGSQMSAEECGGTVTG